MKVSAHLIIVELRRRGRRRECRDKMPDYGYQEFMVLTGVTDRELGRQYKCPLYGKKYWSAWGYARRHFERALKDHSQEVEEVIKGVSHKGGT